MKTNQKQFELTTIGDITWDLFLKIHEADMRCNKNHQDCKMCLDYGGKIGVDELHNSVGGNAANIAVAARKLGVKTALLGFVGKDEAGKKALEVIQKKQVDVAHAIAQGQTNQSVIISFQSERTILSYKHPRTYDCSRIPQSEWLFLTSTGPGSEKIYAQILQNHNSKIIYNPGSYHLRQGQKFLQKIIKKTYCLIVNLEEAKLILNQKTQHIKDLLFDLNKLGPKIVVITNGREGAYVGQRSQYFHIPSIAVKVVDPTGAGDSFSGAFVAALIQGYDIREALRWGIANSTSLIQKLGTEEGLLNEKQIKQKLTNLDPGVSEI